MPDNVSANVTLEATSSSPIILPSGASPANAQFSRDGMDLFLTSPGGHAIRVEGYFAHDPAPDLVSTDGGRLSPQMVDAFLPAQHPHEMASSAPAAANDVSAVGKITEVVGEANIVHTDGSHVRADSGMAVHMGDVIETSAKGAVHILFSDNTTFAISESARLSIDNYTYNPEAHTGTSFFSMLHGVFVYTSGLIGKNDPGSVNIETPVGSIGIRGTVVAGNIHDAGQPSTITIVDGAIVVTNGGGTLQMNSAFDTVTLNGYSTAPADGGALSAQSFNTTYSAVAPADPGFYTLTGTAPPAVHNAPATPNQQTTPDGMTQATPDHPVTTAVNATPVTVTAAVDPTAASHTVTLTDPTIATPATTTTFTDTTSTSTFGTTGTTTGFGTDTGTTGTGVSTVTLSGGTSIGTGTAIGVGTVGTGTGTGTGTSTPATAQFQFTGAYLNGTPGNTADDGIPMFGPALASLFSTGTWNTTTDIGQVVTTGLSSPTFSLSGPGVVVNGTGGWDIVAPALVFNVFTGTLGDTAPGANTTIMHIDIGPTGVLSLTFTDPMSALANIQAPGFFQNFSITATDSTSASASTQNFSFQFQPNFLSLNPTVQIGDEPGAGYADTFFSVAGNNIMWGKAGADTFYLSTGGNNLVIGDGGNDTVNWNGLGTAKIFAGAGNDLMVVQTPGFLSDGISSVNGGAGSDVLQVGAFTGLAQTYNFEGVKNISNIETLQIAGGLTTANTVKLDFQDIFDMSATHTLTIQNSATGFGTNVIIDTNGELSGAATVAGSLTGAGTVTISGQLISNGQTVTLIIDKGAGLINDGAAVTLN